MFKLTALRRQLVLGATLLAAGLTPFVSSTAIGQTVLFNCTPVTVGSFNNRVHVRCSTGGYPGTSILYFAVCTTPDSASASRFLSVFTTARVTDKQLTIQYNASDTSGTACGCTAADCRLTSGAEAH